MPSRLMRSAAAISSRDEPSPRPKDLSMSCSQYLSRRLKVSRCAQDEILISSANPLRIWALGRVRRNVKSRNVWIGAWYAPSRFLVSP